MRWIAKKLGIHRNTVKKSITQKKQPQYHKQKRRQSILSPYHQIIRDWLDEDDFTATWIFDKLKSLGYTGGYDTVRYFVGDVKHQKAQLAYIRFETKPGRQAHMDWADFKIFNPDGTHFFVYLFILLLGFSRAMFAWFVERCTLQAFMDSHIAGFRYLGGVPTETLY
jgi:transposase